jgi:hypothetical protein
MIKKYRLYNYFHQSAAQAGWRNERIIHSLENKQTMIAHDIFMKCVVTATVFCSRHEANLSGNLHWINQQK